MTAVPVTMCTAFQATIARSPEAVAVRTAGDGVTMTFREWGVRARELAAGFAALGVGRGSKVALMMTNRPEFYPVDTAVVHLGGVPFSMYNTSSPEQIHHLLSDSGATVVVCEAQFLPAIEKARAGTGVRFIVCIDGEGGMSLAELAAAADPDFDFESCWRAVEPDDVLTLIYTSGTTGAPKGVQITHANMVAMVDASIRLADATADERVLSFLPSAHIADRWSALYLCRALGNTVTTVAERAGFAPGLADCRPTLLGAVPQVWQKLRTGIEEKLGEATGVKAGLAKWAVGVGRRYSDARLDGDRIGPGLRASHAIADRLVLSKVRAALGLDSLKVAISGAAPVSTELLRWFNGFGIEVSDAWGMSEVSGMGSICPPGRFRLGTVGKPLDGLDVRIAEDGEVLVRGPLVMKGYLNRPEQTAEVIDADGWLHTGDIGDLDGDGYLRIVDRKKELIINAGGKNMSPATIENWVKAFSPLVAQAIAVGDNRKYNVALIALDPDAVGGFAEKHGLAADPTRLATHPEMEIMISAAVSAANAKLSRVEQIKKFRIVPEFWQPGSELLTPTMKPRRKPIHARYANLIEELYA
ncbi:AMP-dependent synthetase/ligase [Nocardia seriolae]|uniref:AMP-dependent synthetase/ligase n=1 Tax=Nocardia seriolae TaxID=37332 RepID=UPI00051A636A|nr:long-chain fatty acid--CoA ligase [Nocardia seriolae]MTJ65164.1 AMP-binding protein [Nocardia seriolae]MTJ71262.1 AMP-binding protein [Nocardia seriolae]MTJ86912.1 AMP-binding protein [Nocardia seriolae]MTK30907.1 AMP-binding protein [Nocardia seriolae]MTK43118.1 AMP-binding protein [Nocardia seriolae]